MTYKQYFKRALSLAPHVVMIKIYQFALFRLKSYFLQTRDSVLGTYSQSIQQCDFRPIFSAAPDPGLLSTQFPELKTITEKTLNHEFDLLGSGWVKVFYGMSAKGIGGYQYPSQLKNPPVPGAFSWINHFINRSNRSYCQFVWQKVTSDYTPIDWHTDIKSGYEWNSSTWWYRIPYGHKPGVDIKLPWELARNHHLAWLALSYGKAQSEGKQNESNRLAKEFQNQILDFIATNPPRYGVNWRCAMDVSIRAANWILAYEWFRLYGFSPAPEFKSILANSLTDHGRYIFSNLEIGKDGFRGNHYLADVCGLTYIAAFLPETGETTRWLEFCHKALITEMDYQFFDEGTNFEGSTSYHRLSSEMILYASLVFLQLNKDNFCFDENYFNKLLSLGNFSEDVLKYNNEIVQIGDCDNGRFFKIQPIFYSATISENHLTHACLIDALSSLNGKAPVFTEGNWLQKLNLRIKHNRRNSIPNMKNHTVPKVNTSLMKFIMDEKNSHFPESENFDFQSFEYDHDFDHPKSKSYPNFGVYIWKDKYSIFTFRCGPIGQKGRGGHDHNDQLSVEFVTKSNVVLYDPGTAIYTPLPELRNKYRSAKAHNGPCVIGQNGQIIEPGALDQGLFSLNSNQHAELIVFSDSTIAGFCEKIQTVRIIKKFPGKIIIWDVCLSQRMKLLRRENGKLPISRGYGSF
jgi:hypothetical protein